MESSTPESPEELSLLQKQRLALLNDPAIFDLLKKQLEAKQIVEEKKDSNAKPQTNRQEDEEWLRRSPYYQERYALFIKPTIDAMIEDREPRCFSYARFPKQKPATLYSLVSQAFKYLVNHLDDDKETYGLFRGEVEICKEVNGVHIYFKGEAINIITGESFLADKIVSKSEASVAKWKKKLYGFLEDESVTRFYEDKLALSSDNIAEIHEIVDNIPTIMAYVKPSCIRLFRGTEEQVKMMKDAAAEM